MSSENSLEDPVSRLAAQSDIVGRLAQDSGGFAAVVAAFESKDADAFRWVLDRLGFLPHCELICEWIRVKLSVLRCTEICRFPEEERKLPTLQQFAGAVAKLAADEKRLRRLVDAVSCGNAEDYRTVITELGLNEYCYLLCRWVSTIIYRRVCEVVCFPQTVFFADAAHEIQATGQVIASVMANKKAFDAISKAALELNCETLRSSIEQAGFLSACEIICRLICSWRCAWVCRELCVPFPAVFTGAYGIEEARNFALASRQLAGQPRALGDLVNAVRNRDAKSYGEIIVRFGLGPYCEQLCAWVCSATCFEFCYCVCPQSDIIPLFTKVGIYNVEPIPNDFNPNGTTVAGALAFTGTIPLNGLLPDGAAPVALKYRFTYQDYSGVSPNPNPVIAITGAMVPATIIGQLEYSWWNGTAWKVQSADFFVNNPGATLTIPQEFGPPLIVSVDADTDALGWIQVPRLNNNASGQSGLFVPTGTLALLDTTKLTNETFDLTGAKPPLPLLQAGNIVPPGALSAKPVFQINFEAQTVSGSTPVSGNSLNAIALSNTTYSYIRHPEWPGSPPPPPATTAPLVLSVDLLELDTAGGCARLDDTVHALYTAYHPYLGSSEVFLQGPGVAAMTLPPGGSITLAVQPNQGQVIGTGTGSTSTFSATLTAPVLPGSVLVNAGAATGTDNALGTISGAGIASGSVDYATGAISVTYTTAPASGVQILVDYNTNVSSTAAGVPFDMTGLAPCAYILWLNATLNLTSGNGAVYGTFSDLIAFCTAGN